MLNDLINTPCVEWSREMWNYAYAEYCMHQMFGPKTKKEFFDMVMDNHKRLASQNAPLSDELRQKWSAGRRAAAHWAKQHGCDMNGRLLKDVPPAAETIEDLQDQVNSLERAHAGLKKAYVAHVAKINRNLPCMK